MPGRAIRSAGTSSEPRLLHRKRDINQAGQKRSARRDVDFNGFGILEGGTIFRVSLIDLSFDGCKIAPDLALFPGLTFQLSVTGFSGTVGARVIWHKDGHAGVEFSYSDSEQRRKTPRAHERMPVSAQVLIRRQGGRAYQACIFDVTPAGCKVEFIERPSAGEVLWAKFDGLEPVEAKVRWVDGFCGGIQFVRPIHPAIFDSLMARLNA